LSTAELAQRLLVAASNYERLTVQLATLSTFSAAVADKTKREVLADIDIVACASRSVAIASRLRGGKVRCIRPAALLDQVLAGAEQGNRHLFYGELETTDAEDEGLPFGNGWSVFGAHPRDFAWTGVDQLAAEINRAGADFIWVCLPSQFRERWLATFRPLLHAPVLVGLTDQLPREATGRPLISSRTGKTRGF
jgi:UDP-N-acetyl-D-mannosaminuronic acid transferase (WecB/TagA/CpsF family)